MRISLVMTVVASDRPGLVDAISTVIAGRDGNWLESRMSRLGGQFAGILRIDIPAERKAGLTAALEALDVEGVHVSVHSDSPSQIAEGEVRTLEVVGHDRPGIVQQISRALALHGVNVEELTSEVRSAAMSGEPLFRAAATVRLPEGCDANRLQSELEKIAADLIVEVSWLQAGS